MNQLQLDGWKLIAVGILYILYLCWVMFGGMRPKRVKLPMYVIMTALMVYGVIKEYSPISNTIELLNIVIILSIGLIKGIILGRKKIAQKKDSSWYIHHDLSYILIWVIFFVTKLMLSQLLKIHYQVSFPLWHMILYFAFYYPWRTINIFLRNKQMRQDLLHFT